MNEFHCVAKIRNGPSVPQKAWISLLQTTSDAYSPFPTNLAEELAPSIKSFRPRHVCKIKIEKNLQPPFFAKPPPPQFSHLPANREGGTSVFLFIILLLLCDKVREREREPRCFGPGHVFRSGSSFSFLFSLISIMLYPN